MTGPLVSVCVVTYNQLDFLEQTVQSALSQDFPSFEVVVTDDGSTDGTPELIQRLAQQDARVVPVLGSHVGFPGNFNHGLQQARGKYFAILGGDDLFLPGKLRAQVDWLEADERRVLCGHDAMIFESETGRDTRRFSDLSRWVEGEGAQEFIASRCPYLPSAIMLRRAAMPAHGFDERIRTCTEEKLYIETLLAGGRYGHVPGIYTRYRRHARNITSSRRSEVLADLFLTLAMIEADHPEFVDECRRGRARLHQRSGLSCLNDGDRAGARLHLRNAFVSCPEYSWKLPAWYGLTWAPAPVHRALVGWLKRRAVGNAQ